MPTKVFKNAAGDGVLVEHQPGNGTRYLGTAQKIEDGPLGYSNQWVVSFPEWGSSYIVSQGGYLTWDYVLEKWGMRRTGMRVGKVDASEMAKMIAMMVPGVKTHAITDDCGRLLEELAA
jgi:hypothetical protein